MSCLGSALFQEGLSSRATQAGGRLAQLLHVPDEAVVCPHHLVCFGRPALVQLGLQGETVGLSLSSLQCPISHGHKAERMYLQPRY